MPMANQRSILAIALVLLTMLSRAAAEQSDLARTPPMGWSSWNHFACQVSDAVIRAQTDAMVSSGMKAAGFTYINIDDCWEGYRDAQGVIHPNNKFPDMKALAEYVHSKGLKIGIYTSPGAETCEHYPGSFGHEEQDAQTYADWGFDYLKYDWCYTKGDQPTITKKMYDAIRKTGRPMVFSLSGNSGDPWIWGTSAGGNLWRTTDDMRNDFYIMIEKALVQNGLEKFAGPSHWNDPDMLEVGNGVFTDEQGRTQMSMWAILAAPLIMGNDLTTMTPQTIAIVTNPEVIAVDQDVAGMEGHLVWQQGPRQVWARPLADGSRAVALLNVELTDIPEVIAVRFRDLGLGHRASVRDLWARKDLGQFQDSFTAHVAGQQTLLLKIR
jgi:alpha-galactosidase